MKFFEDKVSKHIKDGYSVCGDAYMCERMVNGTAFILCDGIGSGVYANIAAITCVNRMMEMIRRGMSVRMASETVASSMHGARKQDIPFSAFSAAMILPDGQFIVYTYEAPEPILIRNRSAQVLKSRFYTAGYEMIGEFTGTMGLKDALILSSDGVTQAGMGHGGGFGIGSEGAANYINRIFKENDDVYQLPKKVTDMCASLANGRYEDDTTFALIYCREAREITILTGPPSKPWMDRDCVQAFMAAPGCKVVCGSTTADIVSRALGEEVKMLSLDQRYSAPPEYRIRGIDLVTEGTIMLNQVYNILGEPVERFVEDSAVERFCLMLREADVINLMIGNASNEAHEALLFKQVGVRVRKTTVKLIAEKLREMGKLVVERYY